MKKMKKNKYKTNVNIITETNSMKLFTMLSEYFLCVLVIYSIFQLFKVNNLMLVQIFSIIIPIIVYLLKSNKKNIIKITTLIIYMLIIIVLPFIYNYTYDLTIDGNSYHKTAIAFIKNGWNPLYESARTFQKNNNSVIKIDKKERVDLWIEHYPKATWIIAANFYNMTGNIESGKCITLIFTIMLIIITYNCLQKILDKKWSIIISVLIALNPIVLAQFFSYYVDGIMGILFAIEILLLILINPKQKIEVDVLLSLAAICTVFCNIKFTGLLCSGVIAAVYYFYWLIINRKDKGFKSIFYKTTISFTIIFLTSIFLVGANSYIKNTIDHHNPLYPLIGKDKVDIITTMQPKSFNKKSGIEKLLISTFSRTQNVTYISKPTLKLPIRLYKSEIEELYAPDVRIAGFGPFEALIVISTLIIFVINFIIIIKKEKNNLKYILLPLISIIVTTVLVGESWWARYVPQLYLLPIGTLTLSVYLSKYKKSKLFSNIKIFSLVLLILINAYFFLSIDYKEVKGFIDIKHDIEKMKNMRDLRIKLGTDNLYGYYYTLNDNNVSYSVVKNIPTSKKRYMYGWRIEVETNE